MGLFLLCGCSCRSPEGRHPTKALRVSRSIYRRMSFTHRVGREIHPSHGIGFCSSGGLAVKMKPSSRFTLIPHRLAVAVGKALRANIDSQEHKFHGAKRYLKNLALCTLLQINTALPRQSCVLLPFRDQFDTQLLELVA